MKDFKEKSKFALRRVRNFIIWFVNDSYKPKKEVLLYLGLNRASTFDKIFSNYKRAIAFEANPELADISRTVYKRYKSVEIMHGALTDFDGTVTFNLTNDDSASSSLGVINSECPDVEGITTVTSIVVPAINLNTFCKSKQIHAITDYISDLQGWDLVVLKTMDEYVRAHTIDTITCEVFKDNKTALYNRAPSNYFSDFNSFLAPDYALTATGWGSPLKSGSFEAVPDEWCSMDCRWEVG